MGTVTKAMREGRVDYYMMKAFFFDVLVRVECSHGLTERSDLHFHLTFEKESFLGGRPKEIPDEALKRILELSIAKDDYPREDILRMARQTNEMIIVRPRASSFDEFKAEALNTLENLEEIFWDLVSPYASVIELSFSQGVCI